VDALERDPNMLVRVEAAEALGQLGVTSTEVVDALVSAMRRTGASLVRAYAAEALAELGLTTMLPVLHERLRVECNIRVRTSLLGALALLGDRGAVLRFSDS
jgi:HEAT repeat protein